LTTAAYDDGQVVIYGLFIFSKRSNDAADFKPETKKYSFRLTEVSAKENGVESRVM